MYLCIYVYVYVYVYIYICICIDVHVSIYIYMVSTGSSYMVCIDICGMVNDPIKEVFRIRYIRYIYIYNWYIIHIIPMNGLITIFDHHTFTTIYWPWRKMPMSVLGVA